MLQFNGGICARLHSHLVSFEVYTSHSKFDHTGAIPDTHDEIPGEAARQAASSVTVTRAQLHTHALAYYAWPCLLQEPPNRHYWTKDRSGIISMSGKNTNLKSKPAIKRASSTLMPVC